MPATISTVLGIKAADIAGLFPMEVSACAATPGMYEADLFAAEWDAVSKASAVRKREFTAGRASARQALAGLGAPVVALPRGPGGAPVWPDGFVGSITHTEGFCAAVTARTCDVASLGLDADSAEPLAHEVERLVCRPGDYPPVEGTDLAEVAWSKVIFSIKEAFYKAQYPLTRNFLDFDAAAISFAPAQTRGGGAFTVGPRRLPGEPEPWPCCSGRWRMAEARVLVGVWVEVAERPD